MPVRFLPQRPPAAPPAPTWYQIQGAAPMPMAALTRDLDFDVVVVGAGLAGLSVAQDLAQAGYEVALLDEAQIAGGASGRNAGFVSAGFALGMDAIAARVGEDHARALWRLSVQGVASVRRRLADAGAGPLVAGTGQLSVRRAEDADGTAREAERLARYGANFEVWPTERLREALVSERYHQALHDPAAFQIDPYAYAQALAARAQTAGLRIFGDTPVTAMDLGALRKHVETPHGRLRANHVVLAASTGIGRIVPAFRTSVLPVATHIAVTEPLGDRLASAVRFLGAVADTRRASDYYRVVDGTRLLWGGRITTRSRPPGLLPQFIEGDIRAVYPQLGRVWIDHVWTGVMGYAVHKMPIVGEWLPGVWIAGAFGGHGLNTTAMAAELIVSAIRDGDDRWRLFAPFGVVRTGDWLGRAGTQVSYWAMQLADRWRERRAGAFTGDARHEAASPVPPVIADQVPPPAPEPVAEAPVAPPPEAEPEKRGRGWAADGAGSAAQEAPQPPPALPTAPPRARRFGAAETPKSKESGKKPSTGRARKPRPPQ
jgi:gamma-glutamylputrescine oxidase